MQARAVAGGPPRRRARRHGVRFRPPSQGCEARQFAQNREDSSMPSPELSDSTMSADPTRQQLDELEALIERMLVLPVAQLDTPLPEHVRIQAARARQSRPKPDYRTP